MDAATRQELEAKLKRAKTLEAGLGSLKETVNYMQKHAGNDLSIAVVVGSPSARYFVPLTPVGLYFADIFRIVQSHVQLLQHEYDRL
jgi:hypothetical protein